MNDAQMMMWGWDDRAWWVIESVFLRSPDKGYWACLGDIPPDMPRRPETQKLLSRYSSYRQTQKRKDPVWEGNRQRGFIGTCSLAERASFYQMSVYYFFLWWSARCSSLQKVYTCSGEYEFLQKKSVVSAMVIIQKKLCMKSLAQK